MLDSDRGTTRAQCQQEQLDRSNCHDLSRDESSYPSLVHRFRAVSRASSPHQSESQQQSKPTCLLQDRASILKNSAVETFATMSMTLKEQAWQSGLVLSHERPEWNENDWPPLEGGWRYHHATVVINHPDHDNNNNNNIRGQTLVVMGGWHQRQGGTNSVLVLNLADPNKRWREGPPMNKKRYEHAAVVCNGVVYVMGGYDEGPLDCIEQIDDDDLLQSSFTTSSTRKSSWVTLKCRLSTGRCGCCAVAVHNRHIVVMGGYNDLYLSSVDIIDTNNHIVTAGPSMTVPRSYFGSAVVGHRIFVVGGCNDNGKLDSLEYLDSTTPCDSVETKKETGLTFISFPPTWTTHSELRLSNARSSCAMVAVGSCLVVAGGRGNSTVEVLDTYRNRMWNLRPSGNPRDGCNMVTVANQVAVIGGFNPTCATLPLMDRNSWCFRRLCEQQLSGWHHFREGMGIRDADISPFCTSTSARKRARQNTRQNEKGSDET